MGKCGDDRVKVMIAVSKATMLTLPYLPGEPGYAPVPGVS